MGTKQSCLCTREAFTAFLLIGISVLCQSLATIFGKLAGKFSSERALFYVVVNPWYVASLAFLGLQAIAWILVLRRLPLSFAYPFMSLIFPLNLLAAHFLFHESVGIFNLLGTAFILAGVVAIAREST